MDDSLHEKAIVIQSFLRGALCRERVNRLVQKLIDDILVKRKHDAQRETSKITSFTDEDQEVVLTSSLVGGESKEGKGKQRSSFIGLDGTGDYVKEFAVINDHNTCGTKYQYCTEAVILLKDGFTKKDVMDMIDTHCNEVGDSVACVGAPAKEVGVNMCRILYIFIHSNNPQEFFNKLLPYSRGPVYKKEKEDDMKIMRELEHGDTDATSTSLSLKHNNQEHQSNENKIENKNSKRKKSTTSKPPPKIQASQTTATTIPTKSKSKYPLWLICDRFKAESLVRVAIGCAIGCSLAVTPNNNGYIPDNGKFLIGLFPSFLPILMPKLVFVITTSVPTAITYYLWNFCMTTVLYFIAENYGQDWMVAAYGIYILMLSSFFFGDAYQSTSNLEGFYIGLFSMFMLLFFTNLDYPENPVEDKSTLLSASQMWTEHGIDNPKAIFRNMLIIIFYAYGCLVTMVLLPFPRTARSLFTHHLLPNVIEEIIEYMCPSSSSSSTSTAAVVVVSANSNNDTTAVIIGNDDDVEAQGQQQKQQMYINNDDDDEERKNDHHKMVYWAFELRGMSKAGLTKYEPRIWKNENLVKPLAALMSDVTMLARLSLFRCSKDVPSVLKEDEEETYHSTLKMCIDALQNSSSSSSSVCCIGTGGTNGDLLERLRNSPSSLERYETAVAERRKTRQNNIRNSNVINGSNDDNSDDENLATNDNTNNLDIVSGHETLDSYSTRFYLERVESVKHSTVIWLDCLNGNTKQQMTPNEIVQNRIEFNVMWIFEPLLMVFTRLYQLMILLPQPSRWELHASCWAIKFSLGLIMLFALEIYEPSYASLGIDFGKQQAYTASTHNGWAIIGYAMAWRPTVEGTVKKGLMRLVGTILGGAVGWVGVIVCSWSYDINKQPNPYGTVIWTTFFTTAAAYFSTDAGPSALFGFSHSHGPIGQYFGMVLALVMLHVYSEPATRNVVVVTRIVSNCVGVLVAMILQFIPPNVYGQYPRDIVPCLKEIQSVFKDTVDAALSLHHGGLSLSSSELYEALIVSGKNREQIEAAYKLLNRRLFLAKDAGALSFIPVMQLHPHIIPLLKEITITLDYMQILERYIAGLKENPDQDSLIKEFYSVMQMGRPVPARTTRRRSSAVMNYSATSINDDGGSRSGLAKLVETRLLDHQTELQSLL